MTYHSFLPWINQPLVDVIEGGPDDRSGAVYLEDPALKLATEIAIVTQRPLLLRGEPGSGKSSFAPFAARNLGWRYYEATITGRTEAKDLLWRFDALGRLRDAQAGVQEISAERYVTPGVLWWAFNGADARGFLAELAALQSPVPEAEARVAVRRLPLEPFAKLNATRDDQRAVVLVDEIDKADPNVPNDLLEAFGLNRFEVEETGRPVKRAAQESIADPKVASDFGRLLLVITTNDERELPAAFIRRCITHTLQEPRDEAPLVQRWEGIASLHMKSLISAKPNGAELVRQVARKCCALREQARQAQRRGPSTAEFLDALRVCLKLDLVPGSDFWQQVERNVLLKTESPSLDDLAT